MLWPYPILRHTIWISWTQIVECSQSVHAFTGKNDIIYDLSSLKKKSKLLANTTSENLLESISHDFRNDFVDFVAEANRSKVLHILATDHLWNEL